MINSLLTIDMSLLSQLGQLPPRDLPLPLPLDEVTLKTLLVPLFLLHIVFVNLMVGGTLLATIYEFVGLRNPKYDELAARIADTVTVNKSMAVVLGVGPLLVISLVYTLQFYTANSLTGHAWILIVPLVTLAFILSYVHKYTWSTWNTGLAKKYHLATACLSTLLFLLIPWIFLANVNLMQFPERWYDVRGFLSSLTIGNGNVFFRYLHFLAASTAVTSLFLCIWLTRSQAVIDALPTGFTKGDLRRHFYKIAFIVSACQMLIGPITLLVMPRVGLNVVVLACFMAGACMAMLLLGLLWLETRAPDHKVGRMWFPIFFAFQLIAYSMGAGRQFYREQALAEHIEAIKVRTDAFESRVYQANLRRQSGLSAEADGRELFTTICASCHLPAKATSAPTSREIIGLYAGKPDDIVAWAKKPGRKRTQYSPMPSMAQLGDKRLRKIAEFMATVDLKDTASLSAPVSANALQNLPPEKVSQAVLSVQGNAERGKELFTTKTCVNCHALVPTEFKKAPSLTGISKIQNKEKLLQNILNPSASFAPGFEAWTVMTSEEEVLTGFIAEETDEVIKLRLNDGTLREIPADEIEARKKSELSPMPKGLLDALTPEQVADLLEFISTL